MEAKGQAEHQAIIAHQQALAHSAAAHAAAPQVYIVSQPTPPSTVLPALLNLFFPPFGQLIQGRIIAFFLWLGINFFVGLILLLITIFTAGLGLILVFVVAPILYILCILDAAWYKDCCFDLTGQNAMETDSRS